MKEIHNMYLLAILGLLSVCAFGISVSNTISDEISNVLVVSVFMFVYYLVYSIAFSVRKEK